MRKSEYPKEDRTLGQKIRKRRMDLGKSLKEIADAADISESYLSRIEADQKIPQPNVAEEIARVLGVNPIDYFEFLLSDTISNTFNNAAMTPVEVTKFAKSKKLSDFLKKKP